jgi:hypothetical protein
MKKLILILFLVLIPCLAHSQTSLYEYTATNFNLPDRLNGLDSTMAYFRVWEAGFTNFLVQFDSAAAKTTWPDSLVIVAYPRVRRTSGATEPDGAYLQTVWADADTLTIAEGTQLYLWSPNLLPRIVKRSVFYFNAPVMGWTLKIKNLGDWDTCAVTRCDIMGGLASQDWDGYNHSVLSVYPGGSIREATTRAKAGDVIVVYPGSYADSNWVAGPFTIMGYSDNPRDQYIHCADTMWANAADDSFKIYNLSMKTSGAGAFALPGGFDWDAHNCVFDVGGSFDVVQTGKHFYTADNQWYLRTYNSSFTASAGWVVFRGKNQFGYAATDANPLDESSYNLRNMGASFHLIGELRIYSSSACYNGTGGFFIGIYGSSIIMGQEGTTTSATINLTSTANMSMYRAIIQNRCATIPAILVQDAASINLRESVINSDGGSSCFRNIGTGSCTLINNHYDSDTTEGYEVSLGVNDSLITDPFTFSQVIPASAMWISTTGGCQALFGAEWTNNKQDVKILRYDATTQETAEYTTVLTGWTGGPIWAYIYWVPVTSVGAVKNVVWNISACSYANGAEEDAAWTSSANVTSSAVETTNLVISPVLTISGLDNNLFKPPNLVHLKVERIAADGADTYDADAGLQMLVLYWR